MNTPPTTTTDISPAPTEEAPRKLDTLEAITAEICERVGLDSLADVPTTRNAWLTDPASGKRVHVEIGKTSPFESKATVFSIFHDEAEARVYTGGPGLPVEVYRFNRIGVSATAFSTMEQFVQAMVVEYELLAADDAIKLSIIPDDDDEPETPETTTPANGATS